jgi:hypothetical protein
MSAEILGHVADVRRGKDVLQHAEGMTARQRLVLEGVWGRACDRPRAERDHKRRALIDNRAA